MGSVTEGMSRKVYTKLRHVVRLLLNVGGAFRKLSMKPVSSSATCWPEQTQSAPVSLQPTVTFTVDSSSEYFNGGMQQYEIFTIYYE